MKKLFVSFLLISAFVLLSGCGLNAKQTQTEITSASTTAETTKAETTKVETTAASQAPTITYVSYENGRFGFSIDYPDSFITKTTPDNGDGILLASKDGNAELSVSGINNALGDTAASFLKSLAEEHTNASLKTTQDNWVILSWTDGDTVFYQKSVIGTGSIDTFVLKYPKTQKDIYATIITYLETSFKTPSIEESH